MDREYEESYEGRLIDPKGVRAGYVRLYSNGGQYRFENVGGGDRRFEKGTNQYLEVEVFGKPVEQAR